jgi:hypothetical protein
LFTSEKVLPHVREALEMISRFETAGEQSLKLALVADYDKPTAPTTSRKVNTIFNKFVSKLESLQLQEFFEPAEQHVTLSTHVGFTIPDQILFKKALQRLRLRIGFNAILFIGDRAEDIKDCRGLGMYALLFDGSGKGDFNDWADAPLLIARLVDPESSANLSLALQVQLNTNYDMQLVRVVNRPSRNVVHALGKKLFPLPLKKDRGAKEMIEVPFTVNLDISLDKRGLIREVKTDQPTAEALAESADYVETLEANKQIAYGKEKVSRRGHTHELITDAKGRKVLTRKQFISK